MGGPVGLTNLFSIAYTSISFFLSSFLVLFASLCPLRIESITSLTQLIVLLFSNCPVHNDTLPKWRSQTLFPCLDANGKYETIKKFGKNLGTSCKIKKANSSELKW